VALEVCMAIFHTATSDANKIPHNKAKIKIFVGGEFLID
jgi:hypothetical protein